MKTCCVTFALLFGLALTQPSSWLPPNVESLQSNLDYCASTTTVSANVGLQMLLSPDEDPISHATYSHMECLLHEMGLWTQEAGLLSKRFAKLFAKQKMTKEVIVVVDYCNDRNRNECHPEKWAFEAYRCATSGLMGQWMGDYVKSLYGAKGLQSASP